MKKTELVAKMRNQITGSDARWMTWASKSVLAGRELKDYHLQTLKTKIGKYANQLVNQSIDKGLIKKVKKGEYIYG